MAHFLELSVHGARCIVALSVLLIWGLGFVASYGWLTGLRRFRPRSDHWGITLLVTGFPIGCIAYLIWPEAPGQYIILSFILVFSLGEIWLRAHPPAPTPLIDLSMEESLFTSRLYRPHHYTLFEPRPNIYSQQGLVHNRWGFREHRPLPPDPLAIRLVFIGGSIVYGVRTHDNCELYTRHLEERLNETYREQLGERHFEVINAGMANATTNEILLRLIFAVSEIRPALVAIQAGICDTWPRTVSDDYFGDYRQARKRYGHGRWLQPELSLADSLARALIWRSALLDLWLGNQVPAEPLLEMCDVERTGHPDRLVRNPPIYFERNLRFMLTLCREMGAFSLLIGDPVPVSQRHCSYQIAVPEHSAVMERLSGERGVPFLDLGRVLPLTDDIRTGDKYLNAEGQRRLAAAIFDHLQQSGQINALLTGVSAPDVPTS